MIKFLSAYIEPENMKNILTSEEREMFKGIVFTNAHIGIDGNVQIDMICTDEELKNYPYYQEARRLYNAEKQIS